MRPVGCWATVGPAWEGGGGSVPGTAYTTGLDPLLVQALWKKTTTSFADRMTNLATCISYGRKTGFLK